MLLQDGFADPGAVGDVIHGSAVVNLGDEDLLGRPEQLLAADRSRQPVPTGQRHGPVLVVPFRRVIAGAYRPVEIRSTISA